MEKLKATRPILYGGRMYEVGDLLPVRDRHMVDAWMETGSAAVIEPDVTPSSTANAGEETAALEGLNKEELKRLCEERSVEIPRGATRALIVERLTAADAERAGE